MQRDLATLNVRRSRLSLELQFQLETAKQTCSTIVSRDSAPPSSSNDPTPLTSLPPLRMNHPGVPRQSTNKSRDAS